MPFTIKLININTISALEVCIGMGSPVSHFPIEIPWEWKYYSSDKGTATQQWKLKTYSSRSLLFTMVLVSRKLIPNPGTAVADMTCVWWDIKPCSTQPWHCKVTTMSKLRMSEVPPCLSILQLTAQSHGITEMYNYHETNCRATPSVNRKGFPQNK